MELKVLEVNPDTGRVSFKVQSRTVSGIDLLIQLIVLDLFSSEGSDTLDQDLGTGMPDLVGANVDPTDLTEITAEISSRISKTQTRIILDQVGVDIPAEERLKQITVTGLSVDDTTGTLDLRLRIENEVGRISNVVL